VSGEREAKREREKEGEPERERERERKKEREREIESTRGGGYEEEQAHLLVDMRSVVNRFGRNKVLIRVVICALCFFLR